MFSVRFRHSRTLVQVVNPSIYHIVKPKWISRSFSQWNKNWFRATIPLKLLRVRYAMCGYTAPPLLVNIYLINECYMKICFSWAECLDHIFYMMTGWNSQFECVYGSWFYIYRTNSCVINVLYFISMYVCMFFSRSFSIAVGERCEKSKAITME